MKQITYLFFSTVVLTSLIACATISCNGSRKNNTGGITITNCNDGIDNDGDGLIDWQYDPGCANSQDDDETAATRDLEAGFTTFDPGADSILIYVSSSYGDDNNDGRSPQHSVSTLAHAATLVRDGCNDFMFLRRGDIWRGENLGRFKSGLDATHPLVVTSYGESTERPRIEVDGYFIDHDGQSRSFVAVAGLQIGIYPKIPNAPDYNGTIEGGIRYVGGGTGLLIEDCHIVYGDVIVQTYGDYHYEDIEIRRNIIEYNYNVDTCGQNATYRPSGMYASHVNGLTIEGNIFDHNGWNENITSACATMYNHNLYLNADNMIIRDNIISRASSMGIKMRSDTTGDINGLLIENNLLVDGEIGISIGGNTNASGRFSSVTIRNNVFSQIGMGNPTERNFSWMLDVQDNNNTVIENNHFLHQPWYTNAYGIQLGGNSESNVTINGNMFYDLKQCSICISVAAGWNGIVISNNTIVDPLYGSCLVNHNGGFDSVVYQNNSYFSSTGNDWFCIDGSRQTLSQWKTLSGETTAVSWTGSFLDPERTVGSYAATLGLQNTLEDFIITAKKQSRLNWRVDLTAGAVNDYIRAGFN